MKIIFFLRWLLIVIVSSVLLLEATLQLASLLIDKRTNTGSSALLPDNRTRIVMMGDSNTYGLYLKAEESYPAVFETLWNQQHPDSPVQVINLGFPGTNSSRVLKSLPDVITSLSPDVITVMVGVNDFWMAPVDVAGVAATVSPIERWLRDHSRVYKLFYMLRRQVFNAELLSVDNEYRDAKYDASNEEKFRDAISGKAPLPTPDKPAAVQYGDKTFDIGYVFSGKTENTADEMKSNMLKMVDIANASGVRLVFITYAYFEMPQKAANQQMKVVSKAEKVSLVNVTRDFREQCSISKERCEALFFPDYHPTAEGYRLLAASIEKQIFSNRPEND